MALKPTPLLLIKCTMQSRYGEVYNANVGTKFAVDGVSRSKHVSGIFDAKQCKTLFCQNALVHEDGSGEQGAEHNG